jgi:hypothetical protein
MEIFVVKLDPSNTRVQGRFVPGSIVLAECDATNGAFTCTLPDARIADRIILRFIKTDSSGNAVTLNYYNEDTAYSIASQYDAVELMSNGSVWRVVNKIVA